MTLYQLEFALRPQFVWAGKDTWATHKDIEGGLDVGIAVFVGLAHLYGFPPDLVCLQLGISPNKHKRLLHWYECQIKKSIGLLPAPENKNNTALTRKQRAHQSIKKSRQNKFLNKTRLVQSFLVNNYGAPRTDLYKAFNAYDQPSPVYPDLF